MNILDKLVKQTSLTQDGRNWAVSALDPFHDKDLTLSGYPDIASGSTVVQLVKLSLNVSAPTTVTTSTWDCSINLYNNSICNPNATQFINGTSTSSGATNLIFGGLSAVGGNTGAQLLPSSAGTYDSTARSVGFTSPLNYVKGCCRVIGMGFEVVNTTAELYKQGQVTVYRQTDSPQLEHSYTTEGNLTGAYYNNIINSHRLPPGNLGDAMLLYGSRSWEAGEGCYVVSRLNNTNNPFHMPSRVIQGYTPNDVPAATGNVTQYFYGPGPFGLGTNNFDLDFPFDISGAWFSGLSLSTTLQINVRWIIERMPGPQESDLVVLAQPASCYDALALELYSQAICGMPPGVRLSENPLGEWFRSALRNIVKYAPKVGEHLDSFVPGAKLLGEGIALVGNKFVKAKTKQPPVPPPKPPLKGSGSQSNTLRDNLKMTRTKLKKVS